MCFSRTASPLRETQPTPLRGCKCPHNGSRTIIHDHAQPATTRGQETTKSNLPKKAAAGLAIGPQRLLAVTGMNPNTNANHTPNLAFKFQAEDMTYIGTCRQIISRTDKRIRCRQRERCTNGIARTLRTQLAQTNDAHIQEKRVPPCKPRHA